MRLSEIEKKAKVAGIQNTWKMSKKELIREIQRKEGNFSCFGTVIQKGDCVQGACCWREDCIR